MTLFSGPVTITGPITVNGPSLEDVRTIVAAELAAALTPLEETMATVLEALESLRAQGDTVLAAVADLGTAFGDLAADVRAALADAADPTVDEQAALDTLQATLVSTSAAAAAALSSISELDVEVGDTDGSDTPPTP